MQHHLKKCVPVMTLLLTVAIAVPSWSAEDENANQAVSESTPSEPAAPAINQETASPETTSTPSAQQPEQAVESLGDSGKLEELPQSHNPLNWVVYKPLWALTGLIGDFNPIGKHVADPLEAAVPGLRFKGFINSITQINTTATNHHAGLGDRDKDWVLQKQELRTQVELKYQVTDELEAVSVNNFLWDGAYSLQDSKGLFRDGSPNQEYYQQGKRIFREAYLRGNYGKLNFTLGKQLVNWGKMDGKVIDIVNAQDSRDVVDFHIGDYEWRAIGQWMAYVSLRPVENTTVSLLWNPDFQPNVSFLGGPAGGSPYWFPFASTPGHNSYPQFREINPSGFHHLADSEAGVRIDTTQGPLSLSGIYYYGFDRDAVFDSRDSALHHNRLNRYGYALDYATNVFGQRLIIRSEGLYSEGKAFSTSDPNAPGGIVKKDQLKLALAFETSIFSDENKIDILYQPIWTHQLGFDSRTGAARDDLLHVINFGHNIRATNDKMSLGVTFYVNAGGSDFGGWAANYSVGWKFNDYLKATVAYNDYQGDDKDIPWGAYHNWRNVTLDLKYEW